MTAYRGNLHSIQPSFKETRDGLMPKIMKSEIRSNPTSCGFACPNACSSKGDRGGMGGQTEDAAI
jgi:hypothetical protein